MQLRADAAVMTVSRGATITDDNGIAIREICPIPAVAAKPRNRMT
jgi:hypothetical protein